MFVKQTAVSQTPSGKDTPPVIYKTWDDGFLVRRLTEKDAKYVQQWFNAIDLLSPDLEMAFDANLKGEFFIGEYNGEPVASITHTNVADGLVYGSYIYVAKEYRRKGLAERLFDFMFSHCDENSIFSTDCVDQTIQPAMRQGYQISVPIRCFVGQVPVHWTLKVQQNTIQVQGISKISIS